MAKNKNAPLRLPSPPTSANAGIQEELLALLDDGSAEPVYSHPSGKSDASRRRAGGGPQSRPPSSRSSPQLQSPLPPRPPSRNGIRPVDRPGDRSVPPKLKDWIRDTNGGAGFERQRGSSSRNGRSHGSSSRNSRGGRIKQSPDGGSNEEGEPGELTRYIFLVVVGMCVFFYKKSFSSSSPSSSPMGIQSSVNTFLSRGGHDEDKSVAPRAQFNFIDSAWRGKEEVQFETFIPPSEIDFAIQSRLRADEERNCDDILLYLPRTTAKPQRGERGAEFNGYLLAALLATYTGKAMVLLELPEAVDAENPNRAGSLFDCPVDAFEREIVRDGKRIPHPLNPSREDFPRGLSRIIRHPKWLSRGCPVPCQSSYNFNKWNDLRKQHVQQVTCQNDNDRQAVVFAVGGEDARRYFESQWREQMLRRPTRSSAYAAAARDWALRLGAKGYEAHEFSKLQREGDVWDYVSALLARSGIVRFQPWIARDVKMLIKGSGLPLNWPYVAVYVHRNVELHAGRDDDFVPFYDYLQQWDSADCTRGEAHPVYVATNDPRRIREEINRLPKDAGGNTLLRGCVKLNFVFNPVEPLAEGGERYDCEELHRADVAAIADLMILAKADTFVGEFHSNLGRLVRIFRTEVNDFPERGGDGPVLVRNTRFAPGAGRPGDRGT